MLEDALQRCPLFLNIRGLSGVCLSGFVLTSVKLVSHGHGCQQKELCGRESAVSRRMVNGQRPNLFRQEPAVGLVLHATVERYGFTAEFDFHGTLLDRERFDTFLPGSSANRRGNNAAADRLPDEAEGSIGHA